MDSKAAPTVHRSKRSRILIAAVFAAVLLAVHLSVAHFLHAYRTVGAEHEFSRNGTHAVGEIVWAPCPRLDDVDVPPGVDCGSVMCVSLVSFNIARLMISQRSEGLLQRQHRDIEYCFCAFKCHDISF